MDTPQVLLDHHLKTLRLPTFLREYDKAADRLRLEQLSKVSAGHQKRESSKKARSGH